MKSWLGEGGPEASPREEVLSQAEDGRQAHGMFVDMVPHSLVVEKTPSETRQRLLIGGIVPEHLISNTTLGDPTVPKSDLIFWLENHRRKEEGRELFVQAASEGENTAGLFDIQQELHPHFWKDYGVKCQIPAAFSGIGMI
ncbi:UNVERIFIED_CONTAM: hypothetical protein K2H54_063411 [Gekko kuhli]